MGLTREDIQAIGALMDDKLEPIKADLQGVKQDLQGVKQEVQGIKQDLQGVKQDLQKLEQRVDDIEHSHKAIRADIATLNHEIVPKVNAMYDGITGINEKFQRLDRLERKQEDHGDRILALEYAFQTK